MRFRSFFSAISLAVFLPIADVQSSNSGYNKHIVVTQDTICSGGYSCTIYVCYKEHLQQQTVRLACGGSTPMLKIIDIFLAKFADNSCPSGCCKPFPNHDNCLTYSIYSSPRGSSIRRDCDGQKQCSFEAIQLQVPFVDCNGQQSNPTPNDYVIVFYNCSSMVSNFSNLLSTSALGEPNPTLATAIPVYESHPIFTYVSIGSFCGYRNTHRIESEAKGKNQRMTTDAAASSSAATTTTAADRLVNVNSELTLRLQQLQQQPPSAIFSSGAGHSQLRQNYLHVDLSAASDYEYDQLHGGICS